MASASIEASLSSLSAAPLPAEPAVARKSFSKEEIPAVVTTYAPNNPRTLAVATAPSPTRTFDSDLPANLREGAAVTRKSFPNGDKYVGEWAGGAPHGTGRYSWVDGSVYEGEWDRGRKHGQGWFELTDGTRYEGEWKDGALQGVGSHWAPDGAFYTGNWAAGVKHGLGRKHYTNGDVYEGFWSRGVPDGPGRYKWSNGNEYFGEWEGGKMSGYGTLTWANGDSYEGEWEAGLEHGAGTFKWADGSCFEGTWSRGLKDGKGLYFPRGYEEGEEEEEWVEEEGGGGGGEEKGEAGSGTGVGGEVEGTASEKEAAAAAGSGDAGAAGALGASGVSAAAAGGGGVGAGGGKRGGRPLGRGLTMARGLSIGRSVSVIGGGRAGVLRDWKRKEALERQWAECELKLGKSESVPAPGPLSRGARGMVGGRLWESCQERGGSVGSGWEETVGRIAEEAADVAGTGAGEGGEEEVGKGGAEGEAGSAGVSVAGVTEGGLAVENVVVGSESGDAVTDSSGTAAAAAAGAAVGETVEAVLEAEQKTEGQVAGKEKAAKQGEDEATAAPPKLWRMWSKEKEKDRDTPQQQPSPQQQQGEQGKKGRRWSLRSTKSSAAAKPSTPSLDLPHAASEGSLVSIGAGASNSGTTRRSSVDSAGIGGAPSSTTTPTTTTTAAGGRQNKPSSKAAAAKLTRVFTMGPVPARENSGRVDSAVQNGGGLARWVRGSSVGSANGEEGDEGRAGAEGGDRGGSTAGGESADRHTSSSHAQESEAGADSALDSLRSSAMFSSGRKQRQNRRYSKVVTVREYVQGVLVAEIPRSKLQHDLVAAWTHTQGRQEGGRRGPTRRAGRKAGELIYKGHRSYDLMTAIQLGLRWGSGGSQVGLRWVSGGAQVGLRWGSGGSQVGLRWGSGGAQVGLRHSTGRATPPPVAPSAAAPPSKLPPPSAPIPAASTPTTLPTAAPSPAAPSAPAVPAPFAPVSADLRAEDFVAADRMWFPPEGSSCTPPHNTLPFTWRDYAPRAFSLVARYDYGPPSGGLLQRLPPYVHCVMSTLFHPPAPPPLLPILPLSSELRAMCGIDPADYTLSLCGDNALRELPSPGKLTRSILCASPPLLSSIELSSPGKLTRSILCASPPLLSSVCSFLHRLSSELRAMCGIDPADYALSLCGDNALRELPSPGKLTRSILCASPPLLSSIELRAMFGIDPADYTLSLCGDNALRELSSPGKSGSVFYLSDDDRFIIKTMRASEVQVLQRMLPDYFRHVRDCEHTLITKFFGLHSIRVRKAALQVSVRVLPHGHKGSSQGRSTEKVAVDETTTLKDLDLDLSFHMPASWRALMHRQIALDTAFLQRQRIMDYSLLLRVHVLLNPLIIFHLPFPLFPLALPQIALDTAFLQRQRIMDYSLLLGVHFRPTNTTLPPVTIAEGRATQDGQSRPSISAAAAATEAGPGEDQSGGDTSAVDDTSAGDAALSATSTSFPNSFRQMKHHMQRPWQRVASTSMADASVGASTTTDKSGRPDNAVLGAAEGTRSGTGEVAGGVGGEAGQVANGFLLPIASQQQEAEGEKGKERERKSSGGGGSMGEGGAVGGTGEGGSGVLLGQGMPATAVRVDRRTRKAVMDPAKRETYQVVLHFGIIDILQEYNTRKKAEHVCKSLRYDGTSISAVNPALYASRFGNFISITFPSNNEASNEENE
ncbi:unnamed protein product [Closterium sp. NIES-65]|nr:unnamed protein product [Closterium sp. NIES-65]